MNQKKTINYVSILSYIFLLLLTSCSVKNHTILYKFLLDDDLSKFEIRVPDKFDTIYITQHRPESPDTWTVHNIQNKKDPIHGNTTWKKPDEIDPNPIRIYSVYESKSELTFKSLKEKLEVYKFYVQQDDSLAIICVNKIVNNDLAILGFYDQAGSYVYAWKSFNKNDIELIFSSKDSTNFFKESETILKSIRIK